MIFELENKVILVTGASSGIGRQICITASELGAVVIACGRNEIELNITLSLMKKSNHKSIIFDLTDTINLSELTNQLPKLDGIVHCAGVAKYIPFKAISEKELRFIQTLNYEAPILLTQSLLRNKLINPKGSIIFITSISGMIGTVANGLYAGSKGALISASRALALEVAGQKIRANCISPGMIITPLSSKIQETISEEVFNEKEKLHPLGFGLPEDVANTTVFLLSDKPK